MADSKAFQLETFVVVVPANLTVDEIKAGFEKAGANVARITQISGAPSFTIMGRVPFEDVSSPISGRPQGDGVSVYAVTVLQDVTRKFTFISEAAETAKRQAKEREEKQAAINAKNKADLIAKKKAELDALMGNSKKAEPKKAKKEGDE